jgi:predicted lipid-binding transport protein (Tim44 family)
MEKTLQQEYQLIKEGKGNKDHFLKVAKHMFPEYITSGNDFTSAVHILKSKSLLSEAIGGIVTQSPIQPDWFKIFNETVTEAIGVKNTKEYGDQNEFEKPAPEVAKDLANQFDNNDPKNIDNLYGQSFLLGYLTEMWDEKNADKTVGELKDIVAKNMAKNINYYHTEASFGVKGIGYKKDVVGGGEPVAPKGKYKSSGYGDMPKTVKEGLNEAKRPSVNDQIKELEKSSQAIALESKLNAIDEAIEKRKAKLSLAESEELAEMIDQSMVKTLNKEIKELEKYKAKTQKIYEKMTGKAKEEVIDEDNDIMNY